MGRWGIGKSREGGIEEGEGVCVKGVGEELGKGESRAANESCDVGVWVDLRGWMVIGWLETVCGEK